MFYPHTRQLGSQAGVQLNQVRDNTDGFVTDVNDQTVAFVLRTKRGRIDAPFKVNRGNLRRKAGSPESLRVSVLNEAMVHVYEAVNNGAREAVLMRLTTANASNQYGVFNVDPTTGVSAFSVSSAPPASNYAFYLRDLECFNDGVILEVNAPKVTDALGVPVATKVITVRVKEPDGTLRYEVTGSLNQAAVDEYGKDYYIGSKIAEQTDTIQITANQATSIATNADCYGRASDGSERLAKTAVPLILFLENGTGYSNEDYDRAIAALEKSTFDFAYLSAGGTQATALIGKLATMATRANRQLIVDVPGSSTPSAAITFMNQLGVDTRYVQGYWAPFSSNDPVNGGRAVIGVSGLQAGMRCARNAETNSYGLAPKNYPIAGKDWSVSGARTGIQQLQNPDEFQLSDLADAKINPVIYQTFNAGGKFVFLDSLTSAKTNGLLKLISTAEMSSSIDDMIAKFGKEVMQLPMSIGLKRMGDFLTELFKGARASGWLVASEDPMLGDKGWTFTVKPNKQRPTDRMDVEYGLHYDGVVRAIYLTQTLQP
jgi:hypothetical protein